MLNKTKWVIDPSHSEIHFKVRHLVISTVTGNFDKFEGSMETGREDLTDAVISFSAEVNSVSTKVPDRDAHLKSADFFDAANHPKLTFKSKSIRKEGNNKYKLTGDLTIRGITHEIALDVIYGGTMTDPYGNVKSGFEMTGRLNRKDFSLSWNAITEAGGVVVSDEVQIAVNVEMVRQ